MDFDVLSTAQDHLGTKARDRQTQTDRETERQRLRERERYRETVRDRQSH